MLSDTERKVLRIVANITHWKDRVPPIQEIAVKAGRSQSTVRQALQALTEKEYIDWRAERHEELRVLRTWDEEWIVPAAPVKREVKWWEKEISPDW